MRFISAVLLEVGSKKPDLSPSGTYSDFYFVLADDPENAVS